jgi:hypothetical protein
LEEVFYIRDGLTKGTEKYFIDKTNNMKQTVKYKLLKLMKGKGTIRRKDLCLLIFKAQGKRGKEAKEYRPGYYGNNLRTYIGEGLIEQPKGVGYKLTKLGEAYIKNPELIGLKIQLKRARSKSQSLEGGRDYLLNELRETRSQLREIEYVLNRNN